MISDVIRLHINDRIFMMISTFVSYFCMSQNLRAILKYVAVGEDIGSRIIRQSGCCMIVSMPMIGIFDNIEYKLIHYALAFTFFTGSCVFSVALSRKIVNKLDMVLYHDIILISVVASHVMCIMYAVFAITWAIGAKYAILEWLIAYLNSCYIITLSTINPYYIDVCGGHFKTGVRHNVAISIVIAPIVMLVCAAIY